MTSTILLCNNSRLCDKFDWLMTLRELITQYNTSCHFFFISILIVTKPVELLGGRKKSIKLFCSSMWQ